MYIYNLTVHSILSNIYLCMSLVLFSSRLKEDSAPEKGLQLDDVLDVACNVAPHGGLNHASGGFCAFITGGGLLHTAVADLLSAVMNRYTGLFLGSPGLVQLESNVISWMAQIVGYDPQRAFGCLTSGGSMANFIGMLVARRHHLSENDLTQGVVMVTSETHSCIQKGLMMAGMPQACLCKVECDSAWRMDPQDLERKIEMQQQAGRKPFLVVATSGTTNAGTVDDMRRLSKVCQRHNIWLHSDGVYGAAFNLTKRGQTVLDGLEEADSIAIDLHKSFFLPHGTGMLLTKERRHLRQAFTVDENSPYYPDFDASDVNFYEMSPELTRSFRGMRIWLPLKLCGLEKWRAALDDRLDWTDYFTRGLRGMADAGVQVTTEPSLTLLTFRYVPVATCTTNTSSPSNKRKRSLRDNQTADSGHDSMELDSHRLRHLNISLLKFINRRGNLFLSPTTLPDGKFVIRICILHLRLTKSRLQAGLADVSDGVREIAANLHEHVPPSNDEPSFKRARTSQTNDMSPPLSPQPLSAHTPIDIV